MIANHPSSCLTAPQTCDIIPQLTGRVEDLQREETNLRSLISDLEERIAWLTSGSREKFGVVIEKKVVLVVDSYEISNVTFGSFCSAVAGLVREQIVEIESFNVIRLPILILLFDLIYCCTGRCLFTSCLYSIVVYILSSLRELLTLSIQNRIIYRTKASSQFNVTIYVYVIQCETVATVHVRFN